jgi:sulfide:quinone oxidoreductase
MRVVISGAGIAALEALAGLHALARGRVEATLLAPDTTFSYRPLSGAIPFTFRDERTVPLEELADGLGARFVRDGLAEVDDGRGRLLTRKGDFLDYDVLVIAVGAGAPRPEHTRASWAELLRELERGAVGSVAFVAPRGAGWPIEAYERSLIAKLAARGAGKAAKVFLVTAEERPLEAFGPVAGEAVSGELAHAGVELLTGVEVRRPAASTEGGLDAFSSAIAHLARRGRRRGPKREVLQLEPGSRLVVDRTLSLATAHGPAISGLPNDERGFVSVDGHARMAGSPRLFAAGDVTSLAVKHSTLASSQGTAAAEAIAAEAGADLAPSPWSPVLTGLLTIPPPFPAPRGSPWLKGGEPLAHCLWWPPGHVAGRYLAPYLASRDPGVRPGLEWHPNGIPVTVRVGPAGAAVQVDVPSPDAIHHDALARRLLAIRRAEREGEQLGVELGQVGDEFERHRAEVVKRLETAGYLTHASNA